jgi:SagB-type dehydrogenase family enzyme
MTIDDSFKSILKQRKTIRKFKKGNFPENNLKELIWAAFGHTHTYKDMKMRTAPSAGATFPIELYFAVEDTEGMPDGIYGYDTNIEDIKLIAAGRFFSKIREGSFDQSFITESHLAAIMVYNPQKIVSEYKESSLKYAAMECGHIAQNLLLMATSLGLGAVPVGAFDKRKIGEIIGIASPKEVLYMIIIGIPI